MALEIDRSDLRRTRIAEEPRVELTAEQARLNVERFGLSSNNVTYAVMGDLMRYWQFFPSSEDGWGRLPVWGFAEVTESRAEGVDVGRRVFGYFPAADELIVTATRADDAQFVDGALHRADLPSAYNGYRFCDRDPIWRADREDHQMVFVPLFFTSFVIDDFLFDQELFGAEELVISSASSKTSIGVAHLAKSRGSARVVGLTSEANASFTGGLGCYDEVVVYDAVSGLDRRPAVYVDVAGNPDVRNAVHHRFEGALGHSMIVGDTHWDHVAEDHAPPVGPQPEFLFAPTQLKKRAEDWGRDGLDVRIADAFEGFCAFLDTWIRYVPARGASGAATVYETLASGQIDPAIGHVVEWRGR